MPDLNSNTRVLAFHSVNKCPTASPKTRHAVPGRLAMAVATMFPILAQCVTVCVLNYRR